MTTKTLIKHWCHDEDPKVDAYWRFQQFSESAIPELCSLGLVIRRDLGNLFPPTDEEIGITLDAMCAVQLDQMKREKDEWWRV